MEQTSIEAYASFYENLAAHGCFLVTGNNPPNAMTIGWALTGYMWKKDILMVPVRLSRYSHDLLNESDEFCVCTANDPKAFKKELAFTGTKSGRDINKAEALGFTMLPSKKIAIPHIAETDTTYECKVLFRTTISPDGTDPALISRFYSDQDYHTLYFAEILACYSNR